MSFLAAIGQAFTDIGNDIKNILTRILPEGGTIGQVPVRTADGYEWGTPNGSLPSTEDALPGFALLWNGSEMYWGPPPGWEAGSGGDGAKSWRVTASPSATYIRGFAPDAGEYIEGDATLQVVFQWQVGAQRFAINVEKFDSAETATASVKVNGGAPVVFDLYTSNFGGVVTYTGFSYDTTLALAGENEEIEVTITAG